MKNITKVTNKTIFYFLFFLILETSFECEVYAQAEVSSTPTVYDYLPYLLIHWTIMSFVSIFVYFIVCWGLFKVIIIRRKWAVLRAQHFTTFLGFLTIFSLNLFILITFEKRTIQFWERTIFFEIFVLAPIVIIFFLWLIQLISWMLYEVSPKHLENILSKDK